MVGGGPVAERKVRGLLGSGARITIVSPTVTLGLQELAERGEITLVPRAFVPTDVDGAFLVVGATGDADVNYQVHQAAEMRGLLVNIVDTPDLSNFIVPACLHRGDLTIAISTAGKSPALARRIREDLEELYPPEYADYLAEIAAIRAELRLALASHQIRQEAWHRLMHAGLLSFLQNGEIAEVQRLVRRITREVLDNAFPEKQADRG